MNDISEKFVINHEVKKFLIQASSMEIHSRLKCFQALFPFAENLPVNFYISGPDSRNLICNQTTMQTMHDKHYGEFIDIGIRDYYEKKGWSRELADLYHDNNLNAIKNRGGTFFETTLDGPVEKKWMSKKEPVYADNGEPLGIIGTSIPLGVTSGKLQWNAQDNCVNIRTSQEQSIDFSIREFTVLQDFLKGASAAEIAEKKYLSPKTIETYLMRIKCKFNCEKQRLLLAYLIQEDLAKDILKFKMP